MSVKFNFKSYQPKQEEDDAGSKSSVPFGFGSGGSAGAPQTAGALANANAQKANVRPNFHPLLKQTLNTEMKQRNAPSVEGASSSEVSPLPWYTILKNMSQCLENSYNPRLFVSPLRILTGTVQQVLQWHKVYSGLYYFELFGYFVDAYSSNLQNELILVIRESSNDTSMEVVYFPFSNPPLPSLRSGMWIRCVGYMTAADQLRAISIRVATDQELQSLHRVVYVCKHSILNL